MALARRDALILVAAGVTAGAAGALAGVFALQSGSGAAMLLAQPFRDTSGAMRRLADWRGRVIVANFWASWCVPCREEVPILRAAGHKYRSKKVQIVGIGVDHVAKIVE